MVRSSKSTALVAGACTMALAGSGATVRSTFVPALPRVQWSSTVVEAARAEGAVGPAAGSVAPAAMVLVSATALAAVARKTKRVTRAAARATKSVSPSDFSGVCDQTGITLNRYMIEMSKRGLIDTDLESVFNSIREATKVISKLVSRAPLSQAELLGLQGEVNIQGEDQKKLDVITNDVLKRALQYTGKLGVLASEEEDAPVLGSFDTRLDSGEVVSRGDALLSESGKYVCVFDPLDGSSNVDAGIAVGTIFGIFKEQDSEQCELPQDLTNLTDAQVNCLASTLQPGKALVAAGYVLYSCSTELVFTLGSGCVGFTLDKGIGEYVLTRPQIQIPARGKIYSANEANIDQWDAPMQEYIRDIQAGKGETGKKYSLRYIGSMVGDIHRTLLYGGIFAYPADKKNLNGKLRLLYEAAPMSFIMEQAGGKAITGYTRVMDIPPKQVHQRVPVILGSKDDVEECSKYFQKSSDPLLKERCMQRLQRA